MKNLGQKILWLVIGVVVGAFGTFIFTSSDSAINNISEGAGNDVDEISRIREFKAEVINSSDSDKENNKGVLYESEKYKFSLYYPEGLIFKEFDEGGGATTVVFQAPGDASTSFQIFISPYTESTITGERILMDVPSGVVNDLKEEQLTEDLRVATFLSNDPFLGETKEIWFIGNGYLYQATTFGNLGDWLKEIIKTVELN